MVNLILDRMRKITIEKNLSQSYLANHLNITQSSYAKIEKGEIKLSLNNLIAIIDFLEIDPATLFYFIKNKSNSINFSGHNIDEQIMPLISNNLINDLAEIKKMIIEMKRD